MTKILRKSFWLALVILLVMHGWYLVVKDYSLGEPNWGVTFSYRYAESLGLDWQEVYLDILNDLGVKNVRIPVYWSNVEKKPGEYDFSKVDWQVIKAAEKGVKVVLVIGYRVPRWPECYAPVWAERLSNSKFYQRVNDLILATTQHFKIYDNISAWQVNNEPFLDSFGDCRSLSDKLIKEEIDIVKSVDNVRPVILTESGELSTWRKSAPLADVIGTSLYRTVWNKYLGYWRYPLPPAFYRLHVDLIKRYYPVKQVIISELQAEPWPPGKSILATSLDEQFKSFDLYKLKHNADYARRTGINDIYFWGVEWWYWLRGQGHPEFWNYTRKIF